MAAIVFELRSHLYHEVLKSYFDTEMKKKPDVYKSLVHIFNRPRNFYGRYLFKAATPYTKVDLGLVEAINRVWTGMRPSPFASLSTMLAIGHRP